MNTRRLAQRSLRTLLTTLATGLIPVLCGMLVMVHQVDSELHAQARNTAARTVYALDRVFDSLRDTSAHIAYAPSYSCTGLAERLRSQVNANPLLRSLRVYDADGSSCGSSEQEPEHLQTLQGLAGPGMALLSERAIEAPNALLSFARQYDDYLLQATVYGEPLRDRLSQFAEGEIIQVKFADHSLWISEENYRHQNTGVVLNRVSKTSSVYGFKVRAGYSAGTFSRLLWQHGVGSLPSFILVGVLTSAGVYLGMLSSQRQRMRAAP
ncbi:CSS-motif domain-containing protein [Pseudomonas cremoricolorata]|uniref:CSS-motif domain-containing protein n=1 Tax=Pseudomonas cremoricolorata TaxID=157783 RepID=UPI000425F71D|nr:CSS-motif domain-containing protein [Pseudomonas cremoricolorata]